MKEFENKIVLISGGLGDIGREIAGAFAKEGAVVCIGDKMPQNEALKKIPDINNKSSKVFYSQVDVTNSKNINRWVEECRRRHGKISISISCAASVTLKNFQNITDDEFDSEILVNLNGAFYFANACAKTFIKDKVQGNIVFLGSWAAHAVHKNIPAYSVSKSAIRMLCKNMALEYANYRIRVNEIAPGYVNAGLSKVVWSKNEKSQDVARNTIPLKEIIESYDIAAQVLWVCSQNCKHMTGSTIVVDGGLSLLRP